MSYLNIRRALEQHLQGITGLPDIAYENVRYTPVNGQNWIRCKMVQLPRKVATIGLQKQARYKGIMFLDIFVPAGGGALDAENLTDTIITEFGIGDILTEDGQRVHILIGGRGTGIEDDPWYMVPVTIEWYAFG